MYDKYLGQFLDEATKHPTTNLGGQVVWNTRYYLESLITAYNATQNPKYLTLFQDTATSVMNLVQTLHVLNIPDPSAPGGTNQGPYIDITGWPTYMGTFAKSISIPTATGAVALYAQSLYPRSANGASSIVISTQPDGSLQFAWARDGNTLQNYSLRTLDDLNAIAEVPLVYGSSIGRIKPTGIGLPVIGTYSVDDLLTTVWQGEQTGGILLPLVRFLLIAKDHPEIVDAVFADNLQSQVLTIAHGYEDQFASDHEGGFTIHNPDWMPIVDADTDAPSDYVFAEVSLRILIYELTGDATQLTFARGLLQHQINHDVPTSPEGWLLIREWPDIHPWSERDQAPAGSIWDSLSFDPATPENTQEAATFVEVLHLAAQYGLSQQLGIPASWVGLQQQTLQNFLAISNPLDRGFVSSIRLQYPVMNSHPGDSIVSSPDPFTSNGYLEPESSDSSYWLGNWQWMQSVGGTPEKAASIGYYLRAWARSEASVLAACNSSGAKT